MNGVYDGDYDPDYQPPMGPQPENKPENKPEEPKQGPTEPKKPEIPLPKFLLNFFTSFGITNDPDSAFYRFCAERIRENIHIVITRSPLDNGHNSQYFKSTIAIMYGDITIFSAPVQSTADSINLGEGDYTLPAGTYKGKFYSETGSYLNPIYLQDNMFLIHPDSITNPDKIRTRLEDDNPNNDYMGPFNPPGSKGCQIMKTSDFNTMIKFFSKIGFKENDTISVQIVNPDNYAYR